MKSAPGFMTVNRLTVNPDLHLGVLAAVASLNWRPIRTLTLNRVGVVCRVCVCVFVCVKVFVWHARQSQGACRVVKLPLYLLVVCTWLREKGELVEEGKREQRTVAYISTLSPLTPTPLGHLPPPGTLLLAVHFIHFVVHIKCLLFSLLLLLRLLLQTVDRLRQRHQQWQRQRAKRVKWAAVVKKTIEPIYSTHRDGVDRS